MSTQIQRRRGTTAQHASFTGAVGETTIDTDKEVVVVHDGVQVGGYPLMRENGSNSALALGSAGTPSLKFTGDTNTGIYSPGADQVAISTAGSGRITIDGSGNVNIDSNTLYVDATNNRVGVGNASPLVAFHVTAASDTPGLLESTGQSSSYLFLKNNAGGAYIASRSDALSFHTSAGATERLRITSTGTLNFVGAGTAGSTQAVSFNGSAPVNSLVVDSSGRLGVGTGSPGARLNIAEGNANAVSTTSTDVNRVLLTDTSGSTSAGVGYSLDFEGTYGGLGRIAISKSNSNTTGTTRDNGAFRLFLNQNLGADSYAAFTEALTIDSGGADQGLIYRFRGTEQFRVDSSGRFLVGTSSFTGEASLAIKASSAGSGTQAMLVLQRGQTNPAPDLTLGVIKFADADSTGHIGAEIAAQSDGGFSWASGDYPTRLVFSTTPDGLGSPTERMRIDSQGRVNIGTIGTVPTGTGLNLYSNSTSNNDGAFSCGNANTTADACVAAFYTATNSTATSNVLIKFGINNYASGSGQINANGASAAAFGTFSDARLKENIEDLPSQWDNIKSLRPVEFDYVESFGGGHQIGFIAQEMQTVYPDAVGIGQDEMLTVTAWSKTEARLVKALQEALERIESLESEVAALKAQ